MEIIRKEGAKMGLKGFFTANREKYYLGDPVSITLVIQNETNKEVYLFVPRGRMDGIQITVKEGSNVQIKDMREEPEPGLVPEQELPPGETYRQQYLLTQWVLFKEPGHYTVECAIQIESYTVSLRQKNVGHISINVAISTDLRFTIVERTEQTTEGER